MSTADLPVASICHAPWTNFQNNRTAWVDQEVDAHHGLVTSRKHEDIPVFDPQVIRLSSSARRLSRQAAAA